MMIALDKRVLRGFDRVIAVSAPIRTPCKRQACPPNRLRLLHNAIVVERYRRTGAQGFLSRLIGRAIPRPVLTTIGRLSVEKGHSDLIDALAILAARGHKVSTVLVETARNVRP